MELAHEDLIKKINEHKLDKLYTVVICRVPDKEGKKVSRYFYINNKTFNIDGKLELMNAINDVTQGKDHVNVCVNTPGTMDYEPFIGNENFDNNDIEIVVHNRPNLGRVGNNTVIGALASDSENKKNAKKNSHVVNEILKLISCPKNISFFGLSMGCHHNAYLLNEWQNKQDVALTENDSIIMYLSHIPTCRIAGVNIINRPGYLAEKVFESIKDKNSVLGKAIREGKFQFKIYLTDGKRYTFHTPNGTIEYLQKLEKLINTITDEEYKQTLLNKLHGTKIYLFDYDLYRFSKRGKEYLEKTMKFLSNFPRMEYRRSKVWSATKNNFVDTGIEIPRGLFNVPMSDKLADTSFDKDEQKGNNGIDNIQQSDSIGSSYILPVIGTTIGAGGVVVGSLSVALDIKTLDEKVNIILISLSATILLCSLVTTATKYYNNNLYNKNSINKNNEKPEINLKTELLELK